LVNENWLRPASDEYIAEASKEECVMRKLSYYLGRDAQWSVSTIKDYKRICSAEVSIQ
jgi:hypothetical protein